MSETTTKGDLANAVDTFFDRVFEYFPPPVFVGRKDAMVISILVSLVVLVISLRPAMKMREQATEPMQEIVAVGVIVACVIMTLLVQRVVQGVVYNVQLVSRNTQHFANTHWVGEYSRARSSPLAL